MPTADALADRLWDAQLAAAPLWASVLGDHRFASALPDVSAEAEAAHVAELREIAAAAAALAVGQGEGRGREADAAAPTDSALVTLAVVQEEAEAEADHLAARLRELEVAPALIGPQVALYEQCPVLRLPDMDAAQGLVRRYEGTGRWFAAAGHRLEEGVTAGRTPSRRAVDAAIAQIDGLLARPLGADPLLSASPPGDADPADVRRWRADLERAVADGVRPALAAYRDHLAGTVAPHARSDERPGLAGLPDGPATYAACIRRFTSLPLDPDELHATGREEVARLAEEYAAIGVRALGTGDVAEVLRRLRDDAALRFADAAEVRTAAEAALARAVAAVPDWFGRLPAAPCEVVEMGPHEAADGTIAYYMPPAEDGSRPGAYHVNTSEPTTRTRFEAEALAFHEAVPGHHLQIALAQELDDLPALRRHLLVNAYVEGWALYTERLADEMGLYSDDLARLGMLSFDSWRACRLVVDTGLHHLGWSRQQAIDYLLEHSPQAPNNIANEVDRYIVWPGQALGYKVGQRRITALRRDAEAALGDAFDLRAFHDEVLRHGAVPLPVLDGIVERWIRAHAQ